MKQRLTRVFLLVSFILLACLPSANATSQGASSASIDWSTIVISTGAQTTFDIVSANGAVQVDANNKGINSEVRKSETATGLQTNIKQTYDSVGNRTVHLGALVDLVNTGKITSQVANSSQNAGQFTDLAQAQQWLYIVLHGAGEIRVQGDYNLGVSGSASNGDPNPSTLAEAGIDLIDESVTFNNKYFYLNDWMLLSDSTLSPASGRFDDDLFAPTEIVLRLAFTTFAESVVDSPAPVPEPASLLFFGAGLVGMALYRVRSRRA